MLKEGVFVMAADFKLQEKEPDFEKTEKFVCVCVLFYYFLENQLKVFCLYYKFQWCCT